jgi:hypothetical protein
MIGQYALCVNNYTLIVSDASSGIGFGHKGCPNWATAKPAAVVNVEHPIFVGIGFVILLAGFLLQLLAVPQPATIQQYRKEIKILQMREREAKRQFQHK